MMHWIFIALFVVAFWHILKLEKEIKKLHESDVLRKCSIEVMRQNINRLNKKIENK